MRPGGPVADAQRRVAAADGEPPTIVLVLVIVFVFVLVLVLVLIIIILIPMILILAILILIILIHTIDIASAIETGGPAADARRRVAAESRLLFSLSLFHYR